MSNVMLLATARATNVTSTNTAAAPVAAARVADRCPTIPKRARNAPEDKRPAASTTKRRVTHDQFNTTLELSAASTPPVTKVAALQAALVAGAATIDLENLTGTNGAAVVGTGLRVQAMKVRNPSTNANAITIARILLIPVFLVILLSGIPEPYADIGAATVFILAAASDKLDGYIARKRRSITTLGQFLDPLADKLLIAAALIALVGQGRVAAWIAMVIIGREVAVSVLRSVGLSQGVSIPADRYGKLKTVLQIVYIVYVLLPTVDMAGILRIPVSLEPVVEWALAILVVAVTLASGINYFRNARGLIQMPGTPPR